MMQYLKEIYDDNTNWLNFAELKNGALLAISGIFLQIIIDSIDMLYLRWSLVILCAITILLTGWSFIPFLNSNKPITWLAKKFYGRKNNNSLVAENIFFYVNVFLSTEDEYTQAVKNITNITNELNEIEKNYIKQIISISTIASIKYFIFSIAMCLFLISVVVFIIFFLLANCCNN